MFCTSLRQRPAFVSVIPQLISSLSLRESQLTTHDLEGSFGSTTIDPGTGHTISQRQLRVLLLSCDDVSEAKFETTCERIRHFASLTGGEDLLIAFLLAPPPASNSITAKQLNAGITAMERDVSSMHAYSRLQAEMINHANIPHVQILPLPKLEGLSELLKKHAAHMNCPRFKQEPATTSLRLLQLCTANPHMSQQTAFILTDIFPSLRDLAKACSGVTSAPNSSSPSARAVASSQRIDVYDLDLGMSTQASEGDAASKLKRLRDLVGDEECRNIVDFWKEDWMID